MKRVFVFSSLCLAGFIAFRPSLATHAATVTSAPPSALVFVPYPNGFLLSKHPALPLLYLGCYSAAASRNLVTLPLNGDGTVATNGVKSFNYFSIDPTNDLYRHQIMRPLVLPAERLLYLAAVPAYPAYFANTNHAEIAAVALDDQGQPGKVVKAFRTSHTEKEVRGWQWEPTTRRIYIGYHVYFGWIGLDRDGLPVSSLFHYLYGPQTFWDWVYEPDWQRFYARQTGSSIGIFRLTEDGSALDYFLNIQVPYGSYGLLQVSEKHRLLYNLEVAPNARLELYTLTREGRVTGIPRYVAMGDAIQIRIDFTHSRFYAWSADSVWQTWALDEQGVPRGPPRISALRCGTIRDVLVDEPSGKVYVLCTEPPKTAP